MNCRGAFLSRNFLLGAGLLLAALILGCADSLGMVLRQGSLQSGPLLETALCSQIWFMALPVLTALPYGPAFLEELASGYWEMALHRTSRGWYVAGKLLAGWLSGCAAAGLSCLGFWLLAAPFSETPWADFPLLPLLLSLLGGGLCAELGMTAALLWNSRAMACFAPFLAVYLPVILQTRYFPGLTALNPLRWRELGWAALLLPAGLGLLCGAALWLYGQRRLRWA